MNVLDAVDLALVHALQLDARAPFTELATVLGVSDQTVARRYAALRRRGTLTITAHRRVTPPATQWLARLTCTPATARSVASMLAARQDTQWVMTAAGGTEVVCIIDTGPDTGPGQGEQFLLTRLPRTPGLVSLRAHNLLRYFVGGPVAWPGRLIGLTAEQQARLRQPAPDEPPAAPPSPHQPDHVDERILDVLARDPRAGYAALAHAAGVAQITARRRVHRLRADGELYFDVHVEPAAIGRGYVCLLWATAQPRDLPAVGASLAGHDTIAMAAAVTGTDNLLAITVTADAPALYDYLTTRFAQFGDTTLTETVPVHHIVKGANTSTRAPH